MKNILIGVLASLSVILSGYIIYDSFLKAEPQCNKAELCEECNCEENNDYLEDNEGSYAKQSSGLYNKSGIIHKLDIYQVISSGNIEFEDITINTQTINIVIKDDTLYINNQKSAYHADYIYVTNNHAYLCNAGQSGIVFQAAINSNGQITDLYDNETIGAFQADDIYLNETGDLVAIGRAFCGLDCTSDDELVKFSYQNNKLQVTKETIK